MTAWDKYLFDDIHAMIKSLDAEALRTLGERWRDTADLIDRDATKLARATGKLDQYWKSPTAAEAFKRNVTKSVARMGEWKQSTYDNGGILTQAATSLAGSQAEMKRLRRDRDRELAAARADTLKSMAIYQRYDRLAQAEGRQLGNMLKSLSTWSAPAPYTGLTGLAPRSTAGGSSAAAGASFGTMGTGGFPSGGVSGGGGSGGGIAALPPPSLPEPSRLPVSSSTGALPGASDGLPQLVWRPRTPGGPGVKDAQLGSASPLGSLAISGRDIAAPPGIAGRDIAAPPGIAGRDIAAPPGIAGQPTGGVLGAIGRLGDPGNGGSPLNGYVPSGVFGRLAVSGAGVAGLPSSDGSGTAGGVLPFLPPQGSAQGRQTHSRGPHPPPQEQLAVAREVGDNHRPPAMSGRPSGVNKAVPPRKQFGGEVAEPEQPTVA